MFAAALALTLAGAVLLVLDVAVGRSFALWASAALLVVLVGLWFVVPLPVRIRTEHAAPNGADRDGEK